MGLCTPTTAILHQNRIFLCRGMRHKVRKGVVVRRKGKERRAEVDITGKLASHARDRRRRTLGAVRSGIARDASRVGNLADGTRKFASRARYAGRRAACFKSVVSRRAYAGRASRFVTLGAVLNRSVRDVRGKAGLCFVSGKGRA